MEGTKQDENKVVENGVENTPQEELPTSENTSQESGSLPENASERTKKEFEKLLNYNKELKAKVKELETLKQQVEPEVSTFKAGFETDSEPSDYIDEDGNVDIARLNRDLKFLKSNALEAKALAEDAKNTIEVEKAVTKHPYLNPASNDYDSQFSELVKDRIARLKLEGKSITLTDAADEVLKVYKPANYSLKEKEDAVAEYKKTQNAKAQVGAINTGRNVRTDYNKDDLKTFLYSNDSSKVSKAIQERLKQAGL
jgi:hypothetical protein